MLPAGRDSRGLWQVDLAGVRAQFAEDDLEQSRLANTVTPHEGAVRRGGSAGGGARVGGICWMAKGRLEL